MIILSQTLGLDGHHGTVGKPTNMSDSSGRPLFVGDLVTMHYKENNGWDKEVGFVCEEEHKYAQWTNKEHQYVMGIAGTWNSDNFKKVDLSANDDNFYDQIDDISDGWVVVKVKDFRDLVIGERWGFLCVRKVQ